MAGPAIFADADWTGLAFTRSAAALRRCVNGVSRGADPPPTATPNLWCVSAAAADDAAAAVARMRLEAAAADAAAVHWTEVCGALRLLLRRAAARGSGIDSVAEAASALVEGQPSLRCRVLAAVSDCFVAAVAGAASSAAAAERAASRLTAQSVLRRPQLRAGIDICAAGASAAERMSRLIGAAEAGECDGDRVCDAVSLLDEVVAAAVQTPCTAGSEVPPHLRWAEGLWQSLGHPTLVGMAASLSWPAQRDPADGGECADGGWEWMASEDPSPHTFKTPLLALTGVWDVVCALRASCPGLRDRLSGDS
eukprot:TRINITY_DN10717_c0_g2_i1.p1 TRINITY_DN10717_c0_g2~~TRINITY_DN10717_c0_g2_i1.p1  ORF type:complete len:340 (+),score=113.22 TRINITY_DN10717_c0_g2_i1:94-1020(+)